MICRKSKPNLYCAGDLGFCLQIRPADSRSNWKALSGVIFALLPLIRSQVKHYRHWDLLFDTTRSILLPWLLVQWPAPPHCSVRANGNPGTMSSPSVFRQKVLDNPNPQRDHKNTELRDVCSTCTPATSSPCPNQGSAIWVLFSRVLIFQVAWSTPVTTVYLFPIASLSFLPAFKNDPQNITWLPAFKPQLSRGGQP